MRIALFHNLPSGGAKRAVYEWTKRLSKKHRIDVYTIDSADHDYCDIRPYVERYHIVSFTPRRLYHRPWGRLNQMQRWRDLDDLTRIGQQIASAIDADSYDVVLAHSCLFTLIPTFIQFVTIPVVYYLHEPFGHLSADDFQRPYDEKHTWRKIINEYDPFIRLYENRLEMIRRSSVFSATRLLANSCFTRDQMRMRFGVDPAVCYLGVDFESFTPLRNTAKENVVISVGELSPRKGFDFIVESLGCIPAQHRPKLNLVCNMVNASEKAYVQALARKSNVEMEIFTNLDTEELAVQYNKSRLCVCAPYMEPFGLVPLEAMSCGTPVVGVKEGGVQESIVHERTGLLVERDTEQFASAVQYLLSNPSLAEEYGRNSRDLILKNWTWENSEKKLEWHLESVI